MSLSKRILLDSALVIGIVFLPWYVLAIAALILYWKFDHMEIIGLGLLMDIAFGSDALHSFAGAGIASGEMTGLFGRLFGWVPFLPFAYGAIASAFVLSLIKKRIR